MRKQREDVVRKNKSTLRAGKNVWVCDELCGCGHEFKSEEKPDVCPQCGWDIIYPKINWERVHGQTYEYYDGDSDWEINANEMLKIEANQNFRGRS